MPSFSKSSTLKLASCHPDLQNLFVEVIKHYDCTIICGYRGEKEQTEAFETGKSQLKFPLSKHNQMPSNAVDVVPYPIDWLDLNRFYHFAGFVQATAKAMGIKVRWGGDWDGDLIFKNEKFKDLPHFELVSPSR
jgi:peptidoglycan L-alanyl-D-glutamate endopeptidase CwlK